MLALVSGLIAMGAALVVAWGSAVRRQIEPLALIVTLLVGSMAQPIIVWTLPTFMIVTLVLSVMMAGTASRRG